MPTIELNREDFESLLGVHLPEDLEELNEILAYVKGEVKGIDSEEIRIELKDSNRADIWSVEGLTRALRGFMGLETGLKRYEIAGSSGVEVYVNPKLKDIRPYIGCAVVKGVKLTDAAIRQIMRFQDKMDQTYGRNRRRTSIGLYEFDLVKPPLHFTVAKPRDVSFVPLEFTEELTLDEILEKHPKGREYGHIVRQFPVWPIFVDSENHVLSFPPIINSNDLGRITEETRNVLIEVTGTSYETVMDTLINVTVALADRGGKIYSAKIHYPYAGATEDLTPNLDVETMILDVSYIQKVIGIKLNVSEIVDLLRKARYGVDEYSEKKIVIQVPCYRVDVLHPIDIVEDVAIAYDYNKIPDEWPQLATVGGLSDETAFRDSIREIMVGLGFQEVLTYIMSNPETLFTRMNLKPSRVVELENPKIISMTCLRNWLLPSLMELLSHNLHVDYPQRIFEVGYCVLHDEKQENKTRDIEKLACVNIHSNANFTEAKAQLDALLSNLGINYHLEEVKHESFIEGRVGEIVLGDRDAGIIGEIHPQVLQNWGLENPASAFEISVDELRRLKYGE
ncbi:phenylalanine--tRNA ligase subunit beta [Candidatus Bathyarchaeota archaeon]|nr:MAG: phenylalanine--tRNA ligase subunit beta [Candidatus Bathyarchaeota archaeon]